MELPSAKRQKPLVWTEERVNRWRQTGCVPSRVMVWTPDQTARFLDHVAQHRLYALFHVMALRGLRHGAATIALACGVDMKVVQDMLGHSCLSITADTYTSVLPDVARHAADAIAATVSDRRAM